MSAAFNDNELKRLRSTPKHEITLPGRDEMLKGLMQVDADQNLQKEFYPLLLQHAGSPKSLHGVVEVLANALEAYKQGGIPRPEELTFVRLNMLRLTLSNILLNVHAFIDVLVPDPAAAQKTKELWKQDQKKKES